MGNPHSDRLSDAERMERKKASQAKWRDANRDKLTAITMAWRAAHPETFKAYEKQRRAANAEHIKAQQVEYRAANRERINAATRQWQLDNPEKHAAYARAYAAENADKVRAKSQRWREANKDKAAAQSKAWAKANPEARRLMQHKRRARKNVGSVSPDIYKRLRVIQRGKCAACRVDLAAAGEHLDHIMPLALGGAHENTNLQLLCPPCNLSKNAKHPVDFMQQRGYLL